MSCPTTRGGSPSPLPVTGPERRTGAPPDALLDISLPPMSFVPQMFGLSRQLPDVEADP